MVKLSNLSVVVIAIILTGQVLLDRVIPFAVLEAGRHGYAALATDCEEARTSWRLFDKNVSGDQVTDRELRKTVKVQLLSCLHLETLKTKLLTWGVSASAIRLIELEVISKTRDAEYTGQLAQRS